MGLVFWYRSDRKVMAGLMILVVATALLAFMPSTWEQRMATIQTYEEDASASQRLQAWQTAINVANHQPLGGGFAMYEWHTSGIYAPPGVTYIRAAHSIYFSALGEHGYIGLLLFVLIWWLTFRVAGQVRKQSKNRPEVAWVHELAGMCQVSLVGYLVGGAFLSLAYFDVPYNILVILVVAQRWLKEGASKQEPAGAFGSAKPLRSAALPHPLSQELK
jgi:putative inorganic carbon (HCO3(-)) transporter